MTDQDFALPAVHVRPATEADVETLFDIRTSVRANFQSREELATIGVTPESVAELLRTDGAGWVAEVGGVPAAFSMVNATERTVFAMFVRPGFEGRGLGRALMARAEAWLFANGFYRRLGWTETGLTESGEIRCIKRRPVGDA